MWRERLKKNWIMILGIECIIIVIMAFIGRMAYQFELKGEKASYETFMKDVLNWEVGYRETGDEPDLDHIYTYVNAARARAGRTEYGVAMRLFGVGCGWQMGVMNQLLSWRSGEYDEKEIIQLDQYFSEDALDAMIAYYYDYMRHRRGKDMGQMEMQRMQGYYDEKERFVPVMIIFGEINEGEVLYTMVNEEARKEIDEDRLFWRINCNSRFDESAPNKDAQGNEYGASWVCFDPTERIYNEKALEKLNANPYGISGYWDIKPDIDTYELVPIINGEERTIRSCRVSFYADLESITLHSDAFRGDMRMILLFCQLAGIAIIVCVLRINERKYRLDQMRNTFINAMAHEMKTPAAVMKNGVECMREGIYPEKQDHYMGLIEREADHMSNLLNAMLVYSKVVDAGYHLKREPVKMSEICQKVLEHYQTRIQEEEICFEWESQGEFCLKGNPGLLEMVMDNFFSNAVRHSAPGGRIHLIVGQTALFLFNTGQHIPDEAMDQIWEPLYQIDAARSGRRASSGMGLAISAQILRLHHMKYAVRNVPGGVEFYIGVYNSMNQIKEDFKKSFILFWKHEA